MYSCFYESKKFFGFFQEERRKKTEDCEIVFFKAITKYFLLTWKSCSWLTFDQMDFMKRL